MRKRNNMEEFDVDTRVEMAKEGHGTGGNARADAQPTNNLEHVHCMCLKPRKRKKHLFPGMLDGSIADTWLNFWGRLDYNDEDLQQCLTRTLSQHEACSCPH